MDPYTVHDDGVIIKVYVQPRASKNEVAGIHGDAIKIRLTTPPIDGKANKALLTFFAKLLHVSKSSVALQSGHQNRNKVIKITGIKEEQLRSAFDI